MEDAWWLLAALKGRDILQRFFGNGLHGISGEKRLVSRDDDVGEGQHPHENIILNHLI